MTERLPAPDRTRFPPLAPEDVRLLPAGTLLGRIHALTGERSSTWNRFREYGPTGSRFDHHPPPPRIHPTRAVLYAAPALPEPLGHGLPVLATCVAECFLERGVIELGRNSPHFVLFRTTRGLRLLDVAGSPWISRAGGNAAISSGLRSTAREWARAIYRHYSGTQAVDGIFYTCSTIPAARSVALWERARDAVPDRPLIHLPLSDPALRAELEVYASDLGLGLVP